MGSGFSVIARGAVEADILIYEDVGAQFGGVTAQQFADDLKQVGSVGTINLRIASLGGDVNEGLAIYRRLVDHPAKVVTHIDSYAASIASVIAMAGNEIRISESGAVMIHDAYAMAIGNADDFVQLADRLRATSGSIADVYVARTKNEVGKVRDWMREETWFYGQEAVSAGFADSVVENMRVVARFDPLVHRFKHAPSNLVARPNLNSIKQRVANMKAKMDRHRLAA